MFRGLAVAMLALALLIAGCGGPSDAEAERDAYVAAIEQARATLSESIAKVGEDAPPTATPRSDAEALALAERAAAEAREAVVAAKPPAEAAAAHRRLVGGLRGYERALSRARRLSIKSDAAAAGDIRAALDETIAKRSLEVDRAIAAIDRALANPG